MRKVLQLWVEPVDSVNVVEALVWKSYKFARLTKMQKLYFVALKSLPTKCDKNVTFFDGPKFIFARDGLSHTN